MNFFKLLLIFSLFNNIMWSQSQNDLKKMNLKSNIKSMNYFKFSFSDKKYDSKNKPFYSKTYYFNNLGFLTKETNNNKSNKSTIKYYYNSDNVLIEKFIKSKKGFDKKTLYSYHDNGKKKKTLTLSYYSKKPTKDSIEYYYKNDKLTSMKGNTNGYLTYNENNKVIKKEYLNKKNQAFIKNLYTYDKNNNLIEKDELVSVEYDRRTGSHINEIKSKEFNSKKKKYKFDILNNIIEKVQFYNDLKQYKTTNSYNKLNNLRSMDFYDEKDSIFCQKLYEYNSAYELIKIEYSINIYNKNYNRRNDIEKIVYEYDEYNNWINKTIYYKSDSNVKREVEKREIVYYN